MDFASLTRITAPASEPVTAAEVRLHTHISATDEDALLNTWIESGRVEAENTLRRALITQTWEAAWDCWPMFPVDLPRAPLISVTSVKYYGTDDTEYTLSSDDYLVDTATDPGRVVLDYGVVLPTTILREARAVVVQYVAGYGDADSVPAFIKDAIMMYCAWRYENRTGEAGALPTAFYSLLEPERIRT